MMDSQRCVGLVESMTKRVLILGGTGEARQLAGALAEHPGLHITLSLAGRTQNPAAQPVPVRVGGFGGAAGLAEYLRSERVELLIDATHPYAGQISRNAAEAVQAAGVELLQLRRPAWVAGAGDDWRDVEDVAAAVEALGDAPRRVFLALGRQEVAAFAQAPQHVYVVRSVDPINWPTLEHATFITARGPFSADEDEALLREHGIEVIVAKNSGGSATFSKMEAARRLGIPVLLLKRPGWPDAPFVESVEEALAYLEKRGV